MKKYVVLVVLISTLFVLVSFINKQKISKAALGKLLFFDSILSKNYTVSCATCHKPQYAFADTSAVSFGVDKKKGTRNTPSAMNLSLQRIFFWDGRATTLEEQALGPIENPDEMNLPLDEALSRLRNDKIYNDYFREVFDSEPSRTNLSLAIAAFERTLETSDTPFDNWKQNDDPNAVNASVKRGFAVFNGKAKCVRCHFGADLTTREFHNIGLFDGRTLRDSGRMKITGKKADIGKFKTPGLRNIAITAPYMHNGKFKTLEQVIDFYNDTRRIVPYSINRDTILNKPLGLTVQEKKDLVTFLRSLTDKSFK
jgi:cytochrome c peroxidase